MKKEKYGMENFAKEFMAKLDGKISDDEMKIILRELEVFAGNYDISKKETALTPYEPQIHECYKTYMVSKKIEGLSEETLKTYDLYLKDFFYTVAKPLENITTNDIRAYLYQYQQVHNVSNRTMDGKRLVINTFFQWCTDEGYILKNVCKQIHPIKYEAKLREPLTDIEMELLRDACRTTREKAIIETFYSTGCRVSELTRLLITDVDFRKGEVHLFGKGSKHRTSYLNAKAEVSLKKYLNSREDNNPALFVSERKPYQAIKKTSVEKIVRSIGERSGIGRRVFPHLIRHTTATTALERGMNVAEVQRILGHEKLDTTMIYAKVCQENVKYNHKRFVV